jgi:aminopeptidase N
MYFKPATPQDLHRNIQKAYDTDNPGNTLDINKIMTTWEDQAGYPLLKVSKSGTNFVITQERYGGGNEIYSIPLSYTTSIAPDFNTKTFKVLMSTKELTTTDLNPTWIILNIQQMGYYEVRYEKAIWQEFINVLSVNHLVIPAKHRSQFFRDALKSFEEAVLSDYMGVLLMEYLESETDTNVWSRFHSLEAYFNSKLFGTEIFNKYHDFLQSLVQPHMTRLGFEAKAGEPADDATLRSRVTATSCRALNVACLNYELNRLKNFIATGSGQYDLCNGMRLADNSVYQTVIASALAETSKAVRANSIYRPGCSLDKTILTSFLEVALDTTNILEVDERRTIITGTMGMSVVALETVMDFIKDNARRIDTA